MLCLSRFPGSGIWVGSTLIVYLEKLRGRVVVISIDDGPSALMLSEGERVEIAPGVWVQNNHKPEWKGPKCQFGIEAPETIRVLRSEDSPDWSKRCEAAYLAHLAARDKAAGRRPDSIDRRTRRERQRERRESGKKEASC